MPRIRSESGYYNADHLRDSWRRRHQRALNTCRTARIEPHVYPRGEAAYQLAWAGVFRRAIALLPRYAHPVAGLCYVYLSDSEMDALTREAGWIV